MPFISSPATPAPPTPAQVVSLLQRQGAVLLQQMNTYATNSIKAIWGASSPQTVIAAMGTNAVSAFGEADALVSLLADPRVNYPVDPAVLVLVKPTTKNADGTVTITA